LFVLLKGRDQQYNVQNKHSLGLRSGYKNAGISISFVQVREIHKIFPTQRLQAEGGET